MMTDVKTRTLVRSAMFAALTFIATYIIKIPTPGTGGYIHPGDAFVILSGVILGPVYGAAAAGIGSALADILGGYFYYAPITLLIKGVI
ncbi:MAG: ECF transporter S component, partial [Lachnospiraceae bacterium]|nr:ECF transporter S component [Lachnospiraceae bacterium]